MKRFLPLAALGATLAAIPAAAQAPAPAAAPQQSAAPGPAAGPEAAVPMTADAFVTAAVASNGFEIESSRLALERSQNAAVRAFAQRMIDDHTMATRDLTAAAEQDGLAPVQLRLDAKHQGMLDQLQPAEGAEFDALYVALQAQAHEEAIALHQAYAEAGDPGALRDFAAGALPVLAGHHAMVRDLTAE